MLHQLRNQGHGHDGGEHRGAGRGGVALGVFEYPTGDHLGEVVDGPAPGLGLGGIPTRVGGQVMPVSVTSDRAVCLVVVVCGDGDGDGV